MPYSMFALQILYNCLRSVLMCSARKWRHKSGGGLPLLFNRPAIIFPAVENRPPFFDGYQIILSSDQSSMCVCEQLSQLSVVTDRDVVKAFLWGRDRDRGRDLETEARQSDVEKITNSKDCNLQSSELSSTIGLYSLDLQKLDGQGRCQHRQQKRGRTVYRVPTSKPKVKKLKSS